MSESIFPFTRDELDFLLHELCDVAAKLPNAVVTEFFCSYGNTSININTSGDDNELCITVREGQNAVRIYVQKYNRNHISLCLTAIQDRKLNTYECGRVEFRSEQPRKIRMVIQDKCSSDLQEINLDNFSEEKYFQLSTAYDIPATFDDIDYVLGNSCVTRGYSVLFVPQFSTQPIKAEVYQSLITSISEFKQRHL